MIDKKDNGISTDTLNFLCEVLAKVTISAGDPNFDEMAAKVSTARRELIAATNQAAAD